MLPLRECISMLTLHDCEIVHNRPVLYLYFYFSYVALSSPNRHQHRVCFAFWKQIMEAKYGSQMRWFDSIA